MWAIVGTAGAALIAGAIPWLLMRGRSSRNDAGAPELDVFPGWPDCPERTRLLREYAERVKAYTASVDLEGEDVSDMKVPVEVEVARHAFEHHVANHDCEMVDGAVPSARETALKL